MVELRRRYIAKYSGLPPEYQQVEYLEGTGEQYIDTGVVADSLTDIEVDFLYVQCEYIAGAGLGNDSSRYAIATNSSLELRFLIGKENKFGFYLERNKRYRVQMNSSDSTASVYDYENNSSENFSLYNTFVSSIYPILLFLRKEGTNQYASPMVGRIYRCIIRQDKNIIKHFIPVYKGGVPSNAGMYDLVSGEFYTNAGTGVFTVGPDVIG